MVKKDRRLMEVDLKDEKANIFMALLQTVDAINKYSDENFYYKEGLSQIKFVVLQVLSIHGGTMKPTDIAMWTFREKHNITTLIRRLERDGLVIIEPSSIDRRSINVSLTKKGEQALNKARPVARGIMERVMASLTDKSIVDLGKIVEVLRQNTLAGFEELNQRA